MSPLGLKYVHWSKITLIIYLFEYKSKNLYLLCIGVCRRTICQVVNIGMILKTHVYNCLFNIEK